MKAQILRHYCKRWQLEQYTAQERIEMDSHFRIAGIKPYLYIQLTNSDKFDLPAKLCTYWHAQYMKSPYAYEKGIDLTDIYRINVKPTGQEMTIREYKKYSILVNIKKERFNTWYNKIKDVSNSIFLTFSEIPVYQWVSIEHYNGECWTAFDLEDSDFKKSVDEWKRYLKR